MASCSGGGGGGDTVVCLMGRTPQPFYDLQWTFMPFMPWKHYTGDIIFHESPTDPLFYVQQWHPLIRSSTSLVIEGKLWNWTTDDRPTSTLFPVLSTDRAKISCSLLHYLQYVQKPVPQSPPPPPPRTTNLNDICSN